MFYQSLGELPVSRLVTLGFIMIAQFPMASWKVYVAWVAALVPLFYREEERVVYVKVGPWSMFTDLLDSVELRPWPLLVAFGWIVAGATGLCILFYTTRFAGIRIRKLVLSRRFKTAKTFRPEALREGSLFEPGRLPSCQVSIYEVGVFRNTQIGFGLRMEDYLVLPTHVLESVDWPRTDLAAGKGTRSVLLDSERFQDPLFDVSYFLLTPGQWAQIGAVKGSFHNAAVSDGHRAWCTGEKGRSHGTLKMSSPGMYVYTGSTLPGMSGAAYESQGGILGMHVGASGTQNLGISSVYLWRRQELLVQEESKRNRGVLGLAAYEDPGQLMDQARARWAVEDINDLLFAARSGDEGVTKWLDKHRGPLGVHKYSYESAEAPTVLKRVTEEVVQASKCSCKNLFHACDSRRGEPNVREQARLGELPEAYVGQSDAAVVVQPDQLGGVVSSIRRLEKAYEDSHDGVVRLTAENQELRDQVAFLEKRLTVLEVWAIDRGYASIPKEVLKPGSPQTLALNNRRKTTPDIPKSQRKPALALTHKDNYVGESSKKVVTPPLIRKAKKAIANIAGTKVQEPMEMKQRLSEHQTYKLFRDKRERTQEEMEWLQRFLERRSLKRKARRARKSSKSPAGTSSSGSTR